MHASKKAKQEGMLGIEDQGRYRAIERRDKEGFKRQINAFEGNHPYKYSI